MALLTNINGKFSVSDAGAVTFNNAFTFPTTDGTANYFLQTNGSGQLAWAAAPTGSGAANRVAYWTTASNISYNDSFQFDGSNVTITGRLDFIASAATYGPYITSPDGKGVQIDYNGNSGGDFEIWNHEQNGGAAVRMFYLSDDQTNLSAIFGSTARDVDVEIIGDIKIDGTFKDSSGDVGTAGQILSSTATGTNWINNGGGTITGSGAANRVTYWDSATNVTSDAGFTYNGAGRVSTDESFNVVKDGADTVADGPFFALKNAAGTRQYINQLDASNNIDYWYYNGSAWTQTISLLNNGGAIFTGSVKTQNTSANAYPYFSIEASAKEYHIGVGGASAVAGYANNLYFYDNTEAAIRMLIDTDGNVGIGTATTIEGRVDVKMNMASINWTEGNWSEVWDSAGTPGTYFNDAVFHIDTQRSGGATGGIVGLAFSPGWQGHQNWGIYSFNTGGGSYSSGDLAFVNQLDNGTIQERIRIKSTGSIYPVNSLRNTYYGQDAGNPANATGAANTAIGYISLTANTSGESNTAVGYQSLDANTTGSNNTGIGVNALTTNTTGELNTAVGVQALGNNTTQDKLTALGYRAGYFWTAGDENTFIGYNSGFGSAAASTGYENTFVGAQTGGSSNGITGNRNTALGRYNLFNISNASDNVAIGHQSMISVTTGSCNVAVGKNALASTNGSDNVAIGFKAGENISTGSYNTVIGYEAGGDGNATGTVLVGRLAGQSNTASYTVAVGYNAALYNTSGVENTAIGYQTLLNYKLAGYNTAVGYHCMGGGSGSGSGNTGTQNTMMGRYAGYSITAGNNNSGFGMEALYAVTTGLSNTAVGFYASQLLQTGNFNVAIGQQALRNSISGYHNTSVGFQSGYAVTSGYRNTLIGYLAGDNITTGSNNICLGYQADPPSSSSTNTIVLGNSAISSLQCQVQTISALSDKRDKTNIKDSNYGLDLIDSLKPVTFEWNQRDGNRKGKKDLGFIAQDLQKVNDEHLDLINNENPEKLLASYSRLIPVLVKSIQELKAEIELLKNK